MSASRYYLSTHTLLFSFFFSALLLPAYPASGKSDTAVVEAIEEKLRSDTPLIEQGLDPSVVSRALFEIVGSTQDEFLRAKAVDALVEILPALEEKEAFTEALFHAVFKGETSLVKTLLGGTYSANVRELGLHWSTPLHAAIQGGHNDIVELLLAHGADPNAVDYQGFRPLYRAIEKENVAVINALLDKGVSVNGFTRQLSWGEEDLPLSLASRVKSIELVNLLLARGADVNADPGTGYAPLNIAAHHPEIATRLIEAGANVNRPGNPGGSIPLHNAANGLHDPDESLTVTRLLLDNGADPNRGNSVGRTAMHSAVVGKSLPILEILIDADGDVNRADHFGFTPYGYADAIGEADVMELLKAKGANTEGVGFNDDEPLHRAALRGDLQAVKKLLNEGADATKLSANNWTPLHAAAICVYMLDPEITAALLKNGADPNAKGLNGWTPLHLDSLSGDTRMLRDLLEAGANPALKDEENKTPRDLAVSSGAFSAVKAIDRHTAAP